MTHKNASKPSKQHLYNNQKPSPGFNRLVKGWLDNSLEIEEHDPPASFDLVRKIYDELYQALLKTLDQSNRPRWEAHKLMLSGLTDILTGVDIRSELEVRLSSELSDLNSFRSPLSQGLLKNNGENFINLIAYALADALIDQDEVLVDKNLPPYLKKVLTLKRKFEGTVTGSREMTIPIEGDLTIFSRSNPTNAIIVNAKTRLKEAFHIGTMWALFFRMLDDEYCHQKWGLERNLAASTKDMLYVFITADITPEKKEGTKGQGPDIPLHKELRNLLAADASFFDYLFVSKEKRYNVSKSLDLSKGREAIVHELGCLLDLVEQKFLDVKLPGTGIPIALPSDTEPQQLDWTAFSD